MPIYVKYSTCIYGGHMHIYMQHMKKMQSTNEQGPLYTYWTYTNNQILLPHSKYSPHSQLAKGYLDPPFWHIYAKTQPTATSTLPVIAKYVPEKYANQIKYICSMCQIFDVLILGMFP